jgi:uncharacterized oxidoreductase
MKLTGNTILITGGTSGIGLELARQLTALGNTIIITGRDDSRLAAAKAELPGLTTIRSDVSDSTAITALYQTVTGQFPDLNILINNAGIMRKINLHETDGDLADITREITTNLDGPIQMVKQFLPTLTSKPMAAILNVSSGLAFVPLPISPVYSATKSGLHAYTLSLRAQMKGTTVKVFELCPPLTATPLVDQFHGDDMAGTPRMPVDKMVAAALKAMECDQVEIRPGASNLLKILNRIAPGFILGQLSKSVDRMLAEGK